MEPLPADCQQGDDKASQERAYFQLHDRIGEILRDSQLPYLPSFPTKQQLDVLWNNIKSEIGDSSVNNVILLGKFVIIHQDIVEICPWASHKAATMQYATKPNLQLYAIESLNSAVAHFLEICQHDIKKHSLYSIYQCRLQELLDRESHVPPSDLLRQFIIDRYCSVLKSSCDLYTSTECHIAFMHFIKQAVKSASHQETVLYIASGPQLHAHTLHEVVYLVKQKRNLHVVYYFRDNEFDKLMRSINDESKSKREVEKGSPNEQRNLLEYFSLNTCHEVRLSASGQDLYFHTKWTAFHAKHRPEYAQILLTSANLIYDHLKDDQTGSRIVNSVIRDQIPFDMFVENLDRPMNSGPVLCRPVRLSVDGLHRLTMRQPMGNYNDVEIFKQVKSFVEEGVSVACSPVVSDQEAVQLHVVSPFFSDELILESLLNQTQRVRNDVRRRDGSRGMKMVVVFKDTSPKGLVSLNADIKQTYVCQYANISSVSDSELVAIDTIINKHKNGLPYTRNLGRLYEKKDENREDFQKAKEKAIQELHELDWWSNVEFIRADEFHCKFLAYGPVYQKGYPNMFEVLMTSANVDTKHMSGHSKKENPCYHNLDWTARFRVTTQVYNSLLSRLEDVSDQKRKNSQKKFSRLKICRTVAELIRELDNIWQHYR